MMRDIRELTRLIAQQNDEVPYFRNSDSPEHTAEMILDEAQELMEATLMAFLTDDLTAIQSEIVDIVYLCFKYAHFLGINIDEALLIKISRNARKYNGYSDGKLARKEWEEKGGDERFFREIIDSDEF